LFLLLVLFLPFQLNQISDLIEKVKIRPVVKTIFDLSEVKEAHKISESGHARGKIVLRI